MEHNTIPKGALPRAERLLEAIKSLTGEKGIALIPFKTLIQEAGFRENQRTSARATLDLLARVGAIKVEWVFDRKGIAKGELVRNPEMSDERVDELVNMGIFQDPKPGDMQAFSPVITVLKSSISE